MVARRFMRVLMVTALLGAFVTPVEAGAQDGRADPRSPGGTEYDIPLEEARRDAGGAPNGAGRSRARRPGGAGGSGTSGGGTSGADSNLFGAGVSATNSSPRGDARGGDRGDPDGGKRGGREGSRGGGRARPGEPLPVGSIPPLARADGSGAAGSWWPALLAAVVLAAGAGLGLLITRLRARRGTTS